MVRIANSAGRLAVAAFLLAALASRPALALGIPFSDNFDSIAGTSLNDVPNGSWTVAPGTGTVDTIQNGGWSITCHNGSNGCIDLDGSSVDGAGALMTSSPFSLVGGQTYRLSAYISGNQRDPTTTDTVVFGFTNATTLIDAPTSTISGIAYDSAFALYTLLFQPASSGSYTIFFRNTFGAGDYSGPILDDVSVSTVPLPPSAWLLLSGLLALGMMARRGGLRAAA